MAWSSNNPKSFSRPVLATRLAAIALALLGVAPLTAASALADPAGPTATPPNRSVPALEARIAEQMAPLMPAGARVQGIKVDCPVEPGAVLKSVAPGVSRLSSRSFVVEFNFGGHSRVCSASVEAQKQVLVATHDLAANQQVAAQDFAPAWVDVFTGAPGALGEFAFSGPLVTTTFLRSGQPLYPNELAKPAAVHPGDVVTVLVKNGAITLRTELESRATASVGDSATMFNRETGTSVQVTVTGVRTGELVLR